MYGCMHVCVYLQVHVCMKMVRARCACATSRGVIHRRMPRPRVHSWCAVRCQSTYAAAVGLGCLQPETEEPGPESPKLMVCHPMPIEAGRRAGLHAAGGRRRWMRASATQSL